MEETIFVKRWRTLYLVCPYTLSLFVIPKRMAARLEKNSKRFLMGRRGVGEKALFD